MAAKRISIMDGHNIIFAIGGLKVLQEAGRRDEARRGLVDRLRRFAQARGEKVLVVFDGVDVQGNPDAIREPFFEAAYARRSDGEADDRIVHEARACLEQGHHVTVVTSDVRTLARDLAKGVRHLEVRAFWEKYIERAPGQSDKRISGDFSDVERDLEALASAAEADPIGRRVTRTAAPASPSFNARIPGSAAADSVAGERLKRKKEMGRLRQERRLERRATPSRRR